MVRKRYYDLNTYFKRLFGERVHKITVDAGFTCPNRDGTISNGGCIYCNEKGSGTGAHVRGQTIREQLEIGKLAVVKRFKAKKYLAYFQSYTNTYAPYERLKAIYDEALSVKDVVGLAIGTRPDCVDDAVLDLLSRYGRTHLIWVEYGLQSCHDDTLARINRGHDFRCFESAVAATRGRNIKICAHVIIGLPGEDREKMLETARVISTMAIDAVKLHLLYVVKGTQLHDLFMEGGYRCLDQEAYAEIICEFLELLPPEMVIQRLTGDPHPSELVAPMWALDKRGTLEMIQQQLAFRNSHQGKKFGIYC